MEALPWVIVAVVLTVIAGGLLRQRPWAQTLALVVHWPVFVAAILAVPASIVYLALVPAKGIAVFHVFAIAGVALLIPVIFLAAWILRCLSQNSQSDTAISPDASELTPPSLHSEHLSGVSTPEDHQQASDK